MADVTRADAVAAVPSRHGRHARPTFWTRYGTDLAVAVGLGVVAAVRIVLLAARNEPTGVDMGNWLMLGHALFGSELPDAATVVYPPLVPALSVALTGLMGVTAGSAVLMGLAGIAPGVGLYLAGRCNGIASAALPAVLLAATSSTGEVVAWGGAPQLIGYGFAAAAIGTVVRLLADRRLVNALWCALSVFGVALSSHLVLAQTVLVLALVVVGVAGFRASRWRRLFGAGTWRGRDGWVACIAVLAVPLLVLVPLYVHLLSTVGQSVADASEAQAAIGWESFRSFAEHLVVIDRDAPWFWRPAILIAAIAPFVLARTRVRDNPFWAPTLALVGAALLQAALSDQARLVFLVPLVTAFGLTLIVDELTRPVTVGHVARRLRAGVLVVLVVALLIASVSGLAYFPRERDFYARLSPPGMTEDLRWLDEATPPESMTLVAPIEGAPFGWWVQGLGRRSAFVGSSDRWLNFPEERDRARTAVQVLTTDDLLGEAVAEELTRLDVDFLVLPWAWGGIDREDIRRLDRRSPGAVAYAGGAMVVLDVRAL